MRIVVPFVTLLSIAMAALPSAAQVRVSPTGVNVDGQGATTVFLTFGGLAGYAPAEALWCGEIVSAAPDIGLRCDPSTIYGALPARYDRSQIGSNQALTDIMALPASVSRRAYQAAAAGHSAEFFYVRRFVKTGALDQFVAVTCRLTGGGARVPLSLVDVQLTFDSPTPILHVAAGEHLPSVAARLVYTGTGRLQGRWEVVLPGQDLPTPDDLVTEATLPVEQRQTQHRYPVIDRFNVFLAPGGRYTLPGPDPARLPTGAEGQYLLLLRIEASDDKEADSDLAAVGAGPGVVHSGGVAAFPMPVLRYIVGSGANASPNAEMAFGDLLPVDGAAVRVDTPVDLQWHRVPSALYYRVEIQVGANVIHQAFVGPATTTYRLPPFVVEKASGRDLTWRVVAIDSAGHDGARSAWRRLTFGL